MAAALANHPSLTATQVANRRVNQQLAPQLAANNAFNTRQNQVIQSFAQALLGKLQPQAAQVGQQYDTAIQQTGALASGAAQYLNAANPSGQVADLLQSVNAPQAQQQQIAGQLGQTFGGGAGVLQFTGGVIPAEQLAAGKAAEVGQAAMLPGLAALKGQQDLSSALWQQGQDRRDLLAKRPALYQSALQDIRTNQSAAAKLAETKREYAVSRGDKLAAEKERVREFGLSRGDQLAAAAEQKRQYNTTLSSNQAIATAKAVAAANTNAQGNVQKFAQFLTSSGFQKETWTPQSLINLAKTGYGITLPANFQAPTVNTTASTKTPKITRDPNTGTYLRENPDGTLTPVYQGGKPRLPAPSTSAPTTKTINGVTFQWDAGRHNWVRAGLPVAKSPSSSGGPKLSTAASGRYGIQIDTSGQPILRNGKTVPYPTTGGTTSSHITAEQARAETARIDNGLAAMKAGTAKDANGKTLPAIGDRAGAMAELEAEGYFSSPVLRKMAMARLNKYYPPDITVRSKGPLGVTATAPPP